ncbi:hypothetical protein [Limnohabitans sp. WS1]|uniref:hypothetical protein n=1 Tax=Limnohabitans sp. WS1 TaxID=1100726 RepID=UPI000D3B8322|nr:hypothetical protein [Limnohabitans sp. WS1]PUE15488.1 hypothetical protein B9Z48_11530 [Limnohabitans sp. WS1]
MSMTDHHQKGVDHAMLMMPLKCSFMDALPHVVESLVPLYGTDGYDQARIGATSFLVGASFCLHFGHESGIQAGDVFSGMDCSGFNPDIALEGFETQRRLTEQALSIQ